MIFSLEALQAGTGDCLILHYGDPATPRFIVIDGGPTGIYDRSLKSRLQQLHDKFTTADTDQLKLEMVMVSHIDDDHIHGILDWMEEVGAGEAVPCNIATLWYNSFDDMLGDASSALTTRVASFSPTSGSALLPRKCLPPASVKAANCELAAATRGILLNGGFKGEGGGPGLVMVPDSGPPVVTRPGGLKLRVIGPNRKHLEDLLKAWKKDVAAHPDPVVVASFVDKAVPNLSSIVAIAEFQGKRILLTGDARGDFIRDGLNAAGLLDADGRIHFDVIKMPHHGSNRNMELGWLQKITADHYVISANGQFGNPDDDTIAWICQARGDDPYTIHLTNEDMVDPKTNINVGARVKAALAAHPGAKRIVNFRKSGEGSVKANVLDEVAY